MNSIIWTTLSKMQHFAGNCFLLNGFIVRMKEGSNLMKYTKKTDYTKKLLQTALIDTIEDKPFSKITVNDIVSRAHLNRSTFYRYYDDKYQLLETIENRLIGIVDRKVATDPLNSNSAQRRQAYQTALNYFQANRQELHALLGDNGDQLFETKLIQKFNQRYTNIMGKSGRFEVQLVRVMVISMTLQALKYWIMQGQDIPWEQMAKIMEQVVDSGPLDYLKELHKAGKENNF